MAIPIHLSNFKAAGIYRVVFDKSQIAASEGVRTRRLVVGYSEKGPFNTPIYITSTSDFKNIFGDISKKLERRGIFFHRLALEMLQKEPVICLNLKKFDGETVDGSTIDTTFNPSFEAIDEVELNVEDIYDTTRFWTLDATKLSTIQDTTGKKLDGYISICNTSSDTQSRSYFIRKASGSKVSAYDITVSDWYKDSGDDVPEYLESKLQNKISDFFAEIYVFKGEFTASQVLTSETLQQYFNASSDGDGSVVLKDIIYNAYGDPIDTLDALYNEGQSGALGHYVGALIPYFQDKQGVYKSLDIVFNDDVDTNCLMMNFDVDGLYEGVHNIDLSGRSHIKICSTSGSSCGENGLSLDKLIVGAATTSCLGNNSAPVITDTIKFSAQYTSVASNATAKRISGTYCVSKIDGNTVTLTSTEKYAARGEIVITCEDSTELQSVLDTLSINTLEGSDVYYGGAYCSDFDIETTLPELLVISISNHGVDTDDLDKSSVSITYTSKLKFATESCTFAASSTLMTHTVEAVTNTTTDDDGNEIKNTEYIRTVIDEVYDTSVSFIPVPTDEWSIGTYDGSVALISTDNGKLSDFFGVGDCLLAADGTNDSEDEYYDNVYVQGVGSVTDESTGTTTYYVTLSGQPLTYQCDGNDIFTDNKYSELYNSDSDSDNYGTDIVSENGVCIFTDSMFGNDVNYLVRIDRPLNQEIGTMAPVYLGGYTYNNEKPASTSMYDKQVWQDFILSTITDYKGLRIGLLNRSELDYRYIIDTFETFVTPSAKSVLSYLAKEKGSAFAILNFPSVRTFVKCPYASFTNSDGIFDVEYVVKGYNPKKAHSKGFSLPSESEGASFCAFYTPLKTSDGYLDSIIPSAGLVSNLFVEKYASRQPYYIVAGPNYGVMTGDGVTGPDYKYTQDELQVIEPYGVNCMVYRPSFGTYINANQTAKQTPKSALSSVNVRELVIYLQDEIENILQAYQWEFNNATVRNKIKDKADAICEQVKANGGLQAYLNVMDETNNTAEIIDNEMAVLSTHIEPGRGMGKMVHELTIYATGKLSSSISD